MRSFKLCLKIGLTPEKTGKKGVLCWSGCEPSTPQSRKGTDDTVTDGRRSTVKKLQLQALLPKLQLHLLPKLWLHLKWLQPLPSTPTGCGGPGQSQPAPIRPHPDLPGRQDMREAQQRWVFPSPIGQME